MCLTQGNHQEDVSAVSELRLDAAAVSRGELHPRMLLKQEENICLLWPPSAQKYSKHKRASSSSERIDRTERGGSFDMMESEEPPSLAW